MNITKEFLLQLLSVEEKQPQMQPQPYFVPSGQNHIVVMTNGFVYVGFTTVEKQFVEISNARNIRKWGTTEGLGQLAQTGPTNETKLDFAGEVFAPLNSVIHFILCKTNW